MSVSFSYRSLSLSMGILALSICIYLFYICLFSFYFLIILKSLSIFPSDLFLFVFHFIILLCLICFPLYQPLSFTLFLHLSLSHPSLISPSFSTHFPRLCRGRRRCECKNETKIRIASQHHTVAFTLLIPEG